MPNKYKVASDSTQPFQFNWTNTLFIIPVQVIGLVAWPLWAYFHGGFQWAEVAIFVFMYCFSCMGISFGYHRGLSHRAFRMNKIAKFYALFAGAGAVEGSALSWCSDHRRHHRYEDTPKDPYNVKRSFWWAHMGWIIGSPTSTDYSNSADLENDPMVRNQSEYYILWMLASAFGLPLFLGFLVGRPLEALLLAGFTKVAVLQHVTWMINSYAHYFGRQLYSKKITAKDSLFLALLSNGEGWHNFHHRFPFDYRNGHRFYHWDPTKWLVYLGQYVGLTSHLKRTPETEVYKARIEAQSLEEGHWDLHLQRLNESLENALAEWRRWSFEKQKMLSEKSGAFDHQIHEIRQKMEESKQEFRLVYAEWRSIVRQQRLQLQG